ncbi:MAG: hypothetical protein LAP85_13695 [Acidobacteriia bacterium]|nr:hypothetical protein [Terriglobia bacterium]
MKITRERILQIVLGLAAVIFLIAGSYREHKVYDKSKEEFGLRSYTGISEYKLVEDATFSGTIRKWGELYSTYDRAVPKGKMACPT